MVGDFVYGPKGDVTNDLLCSSIYITFVYCFSATKMIWYALLYI
jgi:hypothetical protein